jgi:hypothetical protein
MTPQQAIRKFCVECVGSPNAVEDCGGHKCGNGGCDDHGVCWFYPFRFGHGRPSVKLIRKWCLYCQGGDRSFVRECGGDGCGLETFRMGTNPARAGKGGSFFHAIP